jgi:DNA polymerase-3 subunit delta'
VSEIWDRVVGQPRAVAALQAALRAPVHAYLFVGPAGVGKRTAARVFAASLLGEAAAERVLARTHPDVLEYEREGARLSVGDCREITRLALRSPAEGDCKVILIPELDLAAQVAPALLKTLEEPPPGTVFVGMAEQVAAELATIASRCVRIDFGPVPLAVLVDALVGEGVPEERAAEAAEAAGGSLARARLLASDPGFVARRARWASVPERLDGTGAAVARLAEELLASAEELLEPLRARQAAELEEMEERAARYGVTVTGRREVAERHKREQRRVRMDELRAGLATLTGAYRDRLVGSAAGATGAAAYLRALDAIAAAAEALQRNPNELLLLQGLLVRLTGAAAA